MSTTSIITISIALVILAVLVVSAVRTYRRDKDAATVAQAELLMEKHYEGTKNQAIKIGDRIRGQVTNHKVHWLTVTDGAHGQPRTYMSCKDLLDSEELSPEELRELKHLNNHLQNVREYRSENANIPVGYVVLNHPRWGKIIQYTNGLKVLGNRNHVAIRVGIITEEGATQGHRFIQELHVSLNLGVEIPDIYKLTSDNGIPNQEEEARLKEDYLENDDFYGSFEPEFKAYKRVQEEIANFNKHKAHLKYDDKKIALEYQGQRVNSGATKHNYADAPVLPTVDSPEETEV